MGTNTIIPLGFIDGGIVVTMVARDDVNIKRLSGCLNLLLSFCDVSMNGARDAA
jgi:hypothetical protein